MPSLWPFAGRSAPLAALRSAPRGSVVVGPAGAGKSRLASQAVEKQDGVAWVRATAAAAEIPLGAFAHLLPPTPPSGNPLTWAANAIDAGTLVVDDAHLLDPVSAALVHRLAQDRRVRVLATVRSGAPAPDAIVALWKDGLLPRLDLEPLTLAETGSVLEAALGGRIETATLARLWDISQGNALYLRELVLSGVLRDVGGLWLWHGELTLTSTLRETIAARIGELTAEERDTLELLAYGEPLGLDSPVLEQLEARQLITAQQDGKRLQVRLAHPLYGEVIRESCGTLRARAVHRRLAAMVEAAGGRRREDVLRTAVWRLDGGAPGDPGLLARAADQARAVRDLALAERLARAAIDAGGGPTVRLGLAAILGYRDRYAEAEEVFREVQESGLTGDHRVDCATTRAFNLLWGLGRPDQALRVLDEADDGTLSLDARQGVGFVGGAVIGYAGDLDAAAARMDATERLGPLTPRGVLVHGFARASLLACAGRAAEFQEWTDRLFATLGPHADRNPSMSTSMAEARVRIAVSSGDLPAALRLAEHAGGQDGWARSRAQFGAYRAMVLRLGGQVGEALAAAAEAVALLPPRSPLGGSCLGELAHAQALLGDPAAAEATLARARDVTVPTGPAAEAPLRLARVWTLAARGDITGAVETALTVAASPYPIYAMVGLHDLVRLGRPSLAAARLADLPVDGPLLPLLVRHATAATPQALDEVSLGFETFGMLLHAAETSARAALIYRDQGLQRAARAAETRAWTLTRRCQGARTVALLDLDVPGLTPRQREVAVLAARGLTNREIAERLVLSIRTVANTLYAVYERTGVNDRVALADLLDAGGE
ncbi:putative regulatory protein, LuxR [Acrocarpospora phusangensis]|uniref:Regulatory protein, LuxR n=1 Tax=Acrocarpospora phusangensis TaxID=1070424 RepID=A0A919QLL0_9ACTN|nr:helix-turn-helix transcriptional regulator [Acrocarpospora phusangensis]GIH28422.1 putative regulatory protein, LuxR [Acrocarpospora phusangensis]